MMSKKHAQEQRLKEIAGMVGTLTEQMMTAYVLGLRPSDIEVRAFCQGVLLLEDHALPLPLFAEEVIGRLARQEERADAVRNVALRSEPRRGGMLARLLRPLGVMRLA